MTLLDDYLSQPEAATQLHKSRRTLQRWEREKYGPPVTRIGNSPFYDIPNLMKWLAAQREDRPRRRTGR